VLGEATLTAVTVTVFVVGMLAGGVYTPPVVIVPTVPLPPVTPFTCHVTALLARLVTVAEKLSVLPSRTCAPPLIVTDGCEGWELLPGPPVPQPASRTAMQIEYAKMEYERGRRWSCKRDLLTAGARI